jgi:tetratricopeptide (TPR) repeat protein
MVLKSAEEQIANPRLDPLPLEYELQGRYYGPYNFASDGYILIGEYEKAKSKLEQLATAMEQFIRQYQAAGRNDDAGYIAGRMVATRLSAEMLIVDKYIEEKNYNEALKLVSEIEKKYSESKEPFAQYLLGSVTHKKNEIEEMLGTKPKSKTDSIAGVR